MNTTEKQIRQLYTKNINSDIIQILFELLAKIEEQEKQIQELNRKISLQ
jgi:hypothetical protein